MSSRPEEMYASEITGEFIPEPPGSGLMFMNEAGSEHEMPPISINPAFPYFSNLFMFFLHVSFVTVPARLGKQPC